MSAKRSSEKAFPEEDPEFQVAPMIDILLVLMTFFMSITSTEVLKTKTKLTVDLPVEKDSAAPEKAKKSEVLINVAWDPHKNASAIEFEGNMLNSPDQVTDVILRRKGNAPYFRAVVRAAQIVPYSYVQQVLGACAAAQVDNITFLVLSQDAPKTYKKDAPKP
ncbi:MAG: biopolymer transporter ExbD [Verrucomicrobia bacterium]|nr:biopolymer transporter ExbD [Verrucomicrobiota bacterium]